MSIYTAKTGLACAINESINLGMEAAVDPAQGIIQQLLHGDEKALVIAWRGPMDPRAFHEDADPHRGDGTISLVRPGDELYRLPNNIDISSLNIRMGVPLWVLGWENHVPITLAMGLFHPLFCSANLDVFSPKSGERLIRLYVVDHRVPDDELTPDHLEWKRHCENVDLEELDAQLQASKPKIAPVWPFPDT